jgi:hypothetical protein
MINKKNFIFFLFLLFFIPVVLGVTSINTLTKGYADVLYCKQFGTCTLDNLTVIGTYFNASVVNYNITGDMYVTGTIYGGNFIGNITGYVESDPLSLHLDQTTPQSIYGGVPNFSSGLMAYANAQEFAFLMYNGFLFSGLNSYNANTYLTLNQDGFNFGENFNTYFTLGLDYPQYNQSLILKPVVDANLNKFNVETFTVFYRNITAPNICYSNGSQCSSTGSTNNITGSGLTNYIAIFNNATSLKPAMTPNIFIEGGALIVEG